VNLVSVIAEHGLLLVFAHVLLQQLGVPHTSRADAGCRRQPGCARAAAVTRLGGGDLAGGADRRLDLVLDGPSLRRSGPPDSGTCRRTIWRRRSSVSASDLRPRTSAEVSSWRAANRSRRRPRRRALSGSIYYPATTRTPEGAPGALSITNRWKTISRA